MKRITIELGEFLCLLGINAVSIAMFILEWLLLASDVDNNTILWTVWIGGLLSLNLTISCNLKSPFILKMIYICLFALIIASYLRFAPHFFQTKRAWPSLVFIVWPLPSIIVLAIMGYMDIKNIKRSNSGYLTLVGKGKLQDYFETIGNIGIDVIIGALMLLMTSLLNYDNNVIRITVFSISLCILLMRYAKLHRMLKLFTAKESMG